MTTHADLTATPPMTGFPADPDHHTTLAAAHDFHRHGLAALPVAEDGTKRPALKQWKQFQSARPNPADFPAWFAGGTGIGIITGAVSGGLEMTEIEGRTGGKDAIQQLTQVAHKIGAGDIWDRICNGWVEQSPTGGIHWFYRITDAPVPGNTKIATLDARTVLAETRGEGGFVITAPSQGSVHQTGHPWTVLTGGPATIPTLTMEERDAIHSVLRTLDRPGSAPHLDASTAADPGAFINTPGHEPPRNLDGRISPFDDFEARTDWQDILTGWTMVFQRGRTRYWRRPDKYPAKGISATTGRAPDRDRLFVFSSNAGFDPEVPYTKGGAYAVLHHNGDHKAAAAALMKKGFGKKPDGQTVSKSPPPPKPQPISLAQAHDVYCRWLGADYDTQALDAVLAVAAANELDGDPPWLLLLSGSGNAKTETVQALTGAGATVTSTITSTGALLSATSKKERTDDATGGLLRKIGSTGILVIKDVTSILSMDRTARGEVLAGLREVHDGRWSRNVGTDGGKTLTWTGRLIVIGAVTTAWDRAHDVVASMGDRFVIVRMDSSRGRQAAGRQAIRNTGSETRMRQELTEAAAAALANINPSTTPATLTEAETEVLLEAANIVTLVRTGVDYDYRGDVIDAHAPEMPTRFAKELTQIVRGSIALGMPRMDALKLAIRCARDSMPPLRLAILDDVADHPDSPTKDIRRRLGKPRATVDRQLQSLHMLGVLDCEEEPIMHRGTEGTRWRYTVSKEIEPSAIKPDSVPDLLLPPHRNTEKEGTS